MTLDPPPCVALGVRDSAGQWPLALIALHCWSPPKGLQEVAYTPKAISDRLEKGVDSSLTNGSRLYTCNTTRKCSCSIGWASEVLGKC